MALGNTLNDVKCCLQTQIDALQASAPSPQETTLDDGEIVIANTAVTAGTQVTLNYHVISGDPGVLEYVVTPGVGITIYSSSATDNSTITYVVYL